MISSDTRPPSRSSSRASGAGAAVAAANARATNREENSVRLVYAVTPPGHGMAPLIDRLRAIGVQCRAQPDVTALGAALGAQTPDAVIVDGAGAPHDVVGLMGAARSSSRDTPPVIGVVTAQPTLSWLDEVDDFILAQASAAELRMRIARLRRRAASRATTYRRGPLTLDLEGHRAWWRDDELQLSAREFAILSLMAATPGRVVPRETLAVHLNGNAAYGSLRFVEAHVSRLRAKLGEAASIIQTVRGVGYRLVAASPRS